MKEDLRRQMIKIAKYYYEDGLTQEEIAGRLSLSRQKVGRLMQRLVPEGIVKISIDDSQDQHIELEKCLEERFGLKEAVVVTTQETNHLTMNALGKAAAQYLDRILKPKMVLGVAWGRTLAYFSQHIVRERKNLDASIVQLAGGVFPYDHFMDGEIKKHLSRQSGEITRDIATKLGARPYLMHNPLVVDNARTKEVLLQESSVKSAFEKVKECDVMMISIASLGKSVSPFREGVLEERSLKYLNDNKAVGNFLFRYFDINGRIIDMSFYERLMCPDLEDLRKIPVKVCVSGTREKINAIYGGINGGLVDVLITDAETAKALLKKK